jgi:hypothetical protein
MSLKANCPSCGGPVEFKVGTSLVTVCPYCNSVVGRGDRGLESLGKVADLVETASLLDVGLKGRYDNVPFDLVGRTQFKHPAGGVWDEWYAAFADGRWGWLAEAQGRLYMTFERPVPAGLPGYDELRLGQTVAVGDGLELAVAEKQRGQTASAKGEIPYRVVPGAIIPFADLTGPRGEFGTIDYSGDQPALYVGRQVTLDELHIPPGQRRVYPGQEPTVQALSLSCPKCGAALALRAPDRSERVACPSCGGLSDVKQGKLVLLKSLNPPPVQPAIPLGSKGKREGVEWTLIGYMQRYVSIEGADYFWEEYLLYQPRLGFRWLTRSDEHWNWVEAVPPASVRIEGHSAHYADREYRLFQVAPAKVAFVAGEFYWKVQVGEAVESRDFVHAPWMLSEEVTREGTEGEVNWSLATYLPTDEVERMFGVTGLPRPSIVAPNQPFPYNGVYRTALYLLAAACLLGVMSRLTSPHRKVYDETITLKPTPEKSRSQKVTVDDVELRGWRNIRLQLTPRSGAWIHIAGTLRSAQPPPTPGGPPAPASRPSVRSFAFLAAAGRPSYVYLTAVRAGTYTLQYELTRADPDAEAAAEVTLEQGVAHPFPFVVTLLLIGSVPFVVALYQLVFESRRWAGSYVPGGS